MLAAVGFFACFDLIRFALRKLGQCADNMRSSPPKTGTSQLSQVQIYSDKDPRDPEHRGVAWIALLPTLTATAYLELRRAVITRMIASPDGPTFKVPTITGSPSCMLMSVFSPVFS